MIRREGLGFERPLKEILGDVRARQFLQARAFQLSEPPQEFGHRMERIEKDLVDRTEEVMHVIDDDGTISLTVAGEKHAIALTDGQVVACKNKIIIHNHPMGKSFTDLDVKLLMESGAKGHAAK